MCLVCTSKVPATRHGSADFPRRNRQQAAKVQADEGHAPRASSPWAVAVHTDSIQCTETLRSSEMCVADTWGVAAVGRAAGRPGQGAPVIHAHARTPRAGRRPQRLQALRLHGGAPCLSLPANTQCTATDRSFCETHTNTNTHTHSDRQTDTRSRLATWLCTTAMCMKVAARPGRVTRLPHACHVALNQARGCAGCLGGDPCGCGEQGVGGAAGDVGCLHVARGRGLLRHLLSERQPHERRGAGVSSRRPRF
jgi:hypothetical protein